MKDFTEIKKYIDSHRGPLNVSILAVNAFRVHGNSYYGDYERAYRLIKEGQPDIFCRVDSYRYGDANAVIADGYRPAMNGSIPEYWEFRTRDGYALHPGTPDDSEGVWEGYVNHGLYADGPNEKMWWHILRDGAVYRCEDGVLQEKVAEV